MPSPAPLPFEDLPPAHVEDTPDTPTIQTLVDHLNAAFPRDDRPWAAADTLKNVLVLLRHPNGETEPLAVGVPGDREVDPKRLEAQVAPADVEPFDEVQFAKYPALAKGYIGPGALGSDNASGIRYLVDPAVVTGTSWVTGADETGRHVIGLVAGRDFTPDGVIHAAEIRDGDPSPGPSGGVMLPARGIDMGHIFQLGRKYADALDLKVLDQNGKLVTVTMGSYGIGVSRAVAAIAEDNHDDKGLAWPREIAPYDVHLVVAGTGQELLNAATVVAGDLDAAGVSVLLDDRPASPGVKFADAELLGMPTIVVIGRSWATGTAEVRDRASGEKSDVAADELVSTVLTAVGG